MDAKRGETQQPKGRERRDEQASPVKPRDSCHHTANHNREGHKVHGLHQVTKPCRNDARSQEMADDAVVEALAAVRRLALRIDASQPFTTVRLT